MASSQVTLNRFPNLKVLQSSGRTLLQTSAAFGTLLLVLRYWFSRKRPSNLDLDFAKVARRAKQSAADYDDDEYDVIVIGGGTAGCVLAARLSEDPSIRVLLLEAGGSLSGKPEVTIPAAGSLLFRTKYDYNLYTEQQHNAAGRAWYWPRAKLMGGCSTINAMVLHYGAPSDYDEWAKLQRGSEGSSGWSYKEFEPYFRKFERFNPSKDFPEVDASQRGSEGLVDIGHFGYSSKTGTNFLRACHIAGIPRSHDVNTAKGTLGVAKLMTYIDTKGRRVTMESAYLTPAVLARPNLKVAARARVTRILFESGTTPRAVGVEFTDRKGTRFRASARKEIVLSAGAVHTPQILMLSGIGPAEQLITHNIPIVADLPGVGSHLMDHAVVDFFFMDKTKSTINYLRPQSIFQQFQTAKALLQYQLTGKGPLTSNVAECAAFVRSTDTKLFAPSEFEPEDAPEDTSSGSDAPDLELFSSPMAYHDHGFGAFPDTGYYFGLHVVLLRPKSTGTIKLKSADPFDAPIIDPNYFAEPNDVATLVRGARLISRLAQAAPLGGQVDPTGDSHPALHHHLHSLSDEEIGQIIRQRAETLYHASCTARMAPLEDGGVVDPKLRVYGIPNLRIADASIFPTIVSGHTAGSVIAIGEKAADLIKATINGV